ncbi:phage terminase large subunit [Citricoccus sp. NR2]|uniref:phage terminase large subunit n=1 Tax=Citricoccus sp. NR2 TaxID=3004095 RepID=UPI0022DDF3C2|nr:phage terminase large subunit [Citricoccus sp. NR2]WBL18507.1 phage terminase large subunit [Citricoccus sp. NR2]
MSAPSVWELVAQQFDPPAVRWETPGFMAQALDPTTKQTPLMDLFDEVLVWAFNTPDARLLITCPPQQGKSQRVSRRFPMWVLSQRPDTRITIASYETGVARRWGRAVRDDVREHGHQVGLTIRDDVSSQSEWMLAGSDGGVFTAGIGSALTGRPSDLMIVDDPTKGRGDAASEVYQRRNWDWWREVAMTRLAPGAPAIITMTRWAHDDLGGMVLKPENGGGDWRVINVPAIADHNPDEGETDPLGRAPGEWLETTRGMTAAQWERRRRDTGPKSWASLYMGRPTPDEGGVFPADIPTYDTALWTVRPDGTHLVPGMDRPDQEMCLSFDLTFTDGKHSDYVVGQVWLRIGADVYLVDQVRGRMDFNRSVRAVEELAAKWPQATQKFVENKANGPAVINSLQRSIPGIIPVEPEGGKVARGHAVSPFFYSGNVHLPNAALVPNVSDLREEMFNFGSGGGHDDTVDAMTQAINQLLLHPLTRGGGDLEDLFDDDDDWQISPY